MSVLVGKDMDNCSNLTATQVKGNAITTVSLHSTTVVACTIAISLLLLYKCYMVFVYRWVLYLQIVTALRSITKILAVVPVLVPPEENMGWFCTTFAFMNQALETTNMLTICLMATYILLLSVFNYNASGTKQEVTGVVIMISVPVLVDWLPFLWKRYGHSTVDCTIQTGNYCSIDDKYGMGLSIGMEYGPMVLTILYIVVATIVIVLVLCKDAMNHELRWDQSAYHWGLKETMPLVPYPIIHLVVSTIQVALCIYSISHLLDHNPPKYSQLVLKAAVKGLGGLLVPIALFLYPMKELCKPTRPQVTSYRVSSASSEFTQSNEEEQLIADGTKMTQYQSIFEASRGTQ